MVSRPASSAARAAAGSRAGTPRAGTQTSRSSPCSSTLVGARLEQRRASSSVNRK